ncbi:MAG: SPOR domain-containing protein [Bacteroidetes bacterium]|nr:SPOR domain-containing protein [Bacteroidota bacterium]MCL2302613.1 SPOR domain-containing protein [Lentimicrobiaceae bacterium]
MITISLIRALLEENSVTITGLGTFYVKKIPAQIKEDVIYPPQNIIEFEYSKEVEGFDFVSKLSKWEQIRIDEAQAQISEWLDLLEKGLEHSKSVFFDDFGTFSKDSSGKMVFQGVINAQLNIENEGFDPVSISSKNKEKNHPNIEQPVKDKRVILTKKTKKRDKFWFVLIIFLALATLGALLLKDTIYRYYQTVFIKNEVNLAVKELEDEIAAYISGIVEAEDLISTEDLVLNKDKIDENKDKAEVIPPKPSKSNDVYLSYQAGKYYVIAGSFANEADALRHIKEKKLEKYHAKLIVHPDNPRIRVSIGVFDNENDAKEFAAQIDKNYWVLK